MINRVELTPSQKNFLVEKAKIWTADALIHTGMPETEMVIAAEELLSQEFELAEDSEAELIVSAEHTFRLMENDNAFSILFFEQVIDAYTEEVGGCIKVNGIEWDTDGEEMDLPQGLVLTPREIGMRAMDLKEMYEIDGVIDVENYMLDCMSDYLSDLTGFCHGGFSVAA